MTDQPTPDLPTEPLPGATPETSSQAGPASDPPPADAPSAAEIAAREAAVQSLAQVDREVEEAMAAMDSTDLAELSGGGPVSSEGVAEGEELTGTVVNVSDDDIFLEFGAKSQGVLPRNQFGKKETIEVGRRVDVTVERLDNESGLLIVNRKGAVQRATWTTLQKGMFVQGRVTGVVKGGLEIDLKGIRAFMPASHASLGQLKDTSVLLNEVMECEVLEVDRKHKNILVSHRKVLAKQREAAKGELRESLEPGQKRKGVVKTIMEYGAFVDLGGMDGLLHIRELSWGTVDKVTDVLTEGQEVEVVVLKYDKEADRISLGLKQAMPDPWSGLGDKYATGTKLKVRIVRITNFGAFAELEAGVEGLIPVSEMGWSRVQSPGDVVSVGDMVDCAVIRIELDKKRLALSMKQALADPWAGVLESFEPNSLVTGRVTRLADFGAFVELTPGVEGLIHISELSDKHVRTCGEVVQEGQEVETRVLGVDGESRRISLSIKQVKEPTAATPAVDEEPRPQKKRTKPRRGGLSSHYDW
jgi:small subunit ribosomal protein S1